MAVEWVTAVPEKKRAGKWVRICAELRVGAKTRPGEWARIYTSGNTAFATMLKQGKLGDAVPGEFEALSRRNADGKYDIYARFVGVGDEAMPQDVLARCAV